MKSLIKNIANLFGYDIVTIQKGNIRNSIYKSYLHLKELGINPKTIIDVGVANGTPDLYKAFPDSYYLLIEPSFEFETSIIGILKLVEGEYILAAAGNENKEIEFHFHHDHPSGSSLYNETMGKAADGTPRRVNMFRIDDYVKGKNFASPYLLKADVQGAELLVLDGCTEILPNVEIIVLEVSFFQFMKGQPEFYEVVIYMKKIGFVAYDIELAWNRPLDNALGQLNIVFVKENSPLRANHSYSSAK